MRAYGYCVGKSERSSVSRSAKRARESQPRTISISQQSPPHFQQMSQQQIQQQMQAPVQTFAAQTNAEPEHKSRPAADSTRKRINVDNTTTDDVDSKENGSYAPANRMSSPQSSAQTALDQLEQEIRNNPIWNYSEMLNFDPDVILSLPETIRNDIIPPEFQNEVTGHLTTYQTQIARREVQQQQGRLEQERHAANTETLNNDQFAAPQNPLSPVLEDLKSLPSKPQNVHNGPNKTQQEEIEKRHQIFQFLVAKKERMERNLRDEDQQIRSLKEEKQKVVVETTSLSEELESLRSEREETNQKVKRHEIEFKRDDLQERYVRGDCVGNGSFGVVFKAKDKKTGDAVAMKIMKLAKMRHLMRNLKIDRRELMQKIKTEKRVMKQCSHKNIIKFVNFFQNGPTELIMIMEFCSGGSLGDYMFLNGALEEDTAQRFSRQIRDALLYLRSLKITHRDLKPANILLTENSAHATLKLSDFGESAFKVYDENGVTAHQTLAGTGYYMAPEVLAKRDSTLQDKYRSNGNVTHC